MASAKQDEAGKEDDRFGEPENDPVERQEADDDEDLEDLVPCRLQGVTFQKGRVVLDTADQFFQEGRHFFTPPIS